MWIIISIVLILLLVAILIQIPAIQNKIVHYATSYVSDKTHTKVELKHISIAFPKSIVIEGLFLEDEHKDTLIFAGKAKVNIAFKDLMNNKITINSFDLEDVNLNLYNTDKDSLFNYNFLMTAFADTTAAAAPSDTTASSWTFSIEDISMKNIRLRYDDNYGGMNVKASLRNMELAMNQLDLEHSTYGIDNLLVDNLSAGVLMKQSHYAQSTSDTTSVLPKILANEIEIRGSKIDFNDSVGRLGVKAVINDFKLKKGNVDLQKQTVDINSLILNKSQIRYQTSDVALKPDSLPEHAAKKVVEEPKSDWQVKVGSIRAEDNSLAYMVGEKQATGNSFNNNHLEYNQLTLHADSLNYSPQQTRISIAEFHTVDQNGFKINQFKADFRMDEHSITAQSIVFETPYSAMDGDFSIAYDSLAALTGGMKFNNLNADIRNLKISNADILYFNPTLIQQPYFKNRTATTTMQGKVTGSMDNLTGKGVKVRAGSNTLLATDFNIKGMPDYKTAWYDFPDLRMTSGRKDILAMAGPYIPDSIALPENISMEATFKGRMKAFESAIHAKSSFGDASLLASLDPQENFTAKVNIPGFNVGLLMNDTVMYGPVSLTAQAEGHGLDINTIQGNIKADVSQIYLNKYMYHNLAMNGSVAGRQFEGKVNMNDENAVFDFDGLVNMNPDHEQYKFKLNVEGLDLKKLKLTEDNIQLSMIATADMKGGTFDKMNGKAGITNIIVAKDGEKYQLDSLLSATVNEPNKSEINVNSALIDIDYKGTLSPIALPDLLERFINNYFPVSDSLEPPKDDKPSDFKFEIKVHNHPILSKVLLPELTEFEPGIIKGSFDSEKNDLKLSAEMRKIVYGSIEINDFALDVNTTRNALDYKLSTKSVGNTSVSLQNFTLEGSLKDSTIYANVSSMDGNKRKILVNSEITKDDKNYKFTIDPRNFYIANYQWTIDKDNFIEFGDRGLKIHRFFINHKDSKLNIASANDRFNDDLNIGINNFKLEEISQIIEKDTSLVKGEVNGNVLLKRVAQSYGLISDIKVDNLIFRQIPIGNLTLKAENPTGNRFDVNMGISGQDNNISVTGNYVSENNINSFNIKTDIQSLSMKTVEAFSMGQITQAEGKLTGNFLLEGTTDAPQITGRLGFNNVFMKPAYLNTRLEIKDETIELRNDGIYFNTFTLADAAHHTAVIDGSVKMKQFSDYVFALEVNSTDFLLFNTTAKDNKNFFGRMIIDSKINVDGPLELPHVNARVKMKKGSNFTFSVPEEQVTADKGEDVVEFINREELNPILTKAEEQAKQTTGMRGFDLSSIIQIDKEATLRLLMDPASSDSLVVKGEAALSFTMDPSGKMSLTGNYDLSEGSYLVSFESVIKRKFDIASGSTITWNGDPMDATISIDAIYTVRTSPTDLVTAQGSGAGSGETAKESDNKRYPFQVLLKLRGEILKPQISFEIQLPTDEMGKAGPEVVNKLAMLNEDESALNKQVFALLVLGRFIQEDPFATSGGGTSTLVRSTVSKFLSAQLNQLSSKMLPGTEIKFDIQSYDEGKGAGAQGRTDVEFGVKQQLFNERMSVEIGGSVNVEGEGRPAGTPSNISGDVTVEYKLTKDGRFRAKAFRLNQYEALEGQIIETGVGAVYVRDFNKWSKFFKPLRNRSDSQTIPKKNDTIGQK
ncbi:MAG TPA: translocation/assembly module TamB domain-containing protein [Prolixibacteraceae bacterium]|nr:translocation/assembly module TamB domain-containing protein [Prolixibacteraceae bacterium]